MDKNTFFTLLADINKEKYREKYKNDCFKVTDDDFDIDTSIMMDAIKDKSKVSVNLPSIARYGTIVKFKGNKADVKIIMPGKTVPGYDFPILQPNYKFEVKDAEGRKVTITPKINLKPNYKVFIAFIGGNYLNGIIIGKIWLLTKFW